MVPQCCMLLCSCVYGLQQYVHLNNSCPLCFLFVLFYDFEYLEMEIPANTKQFCFGKLSPLSSYAHLYTWQQSESCTALINKTNKLLSYTEYYVDNFIRLDPGLKREYQCLILRCVYAVRFPFLWNILVCCKFHLQHTRRS